MSNTQEIKDKLFNRSPYINYAAVMKLKLIYNTKYSEGKLVPVKWEFHNCRTVFDHAPLSQF